MKMLELPLLWLSSVAWHLWRIATCRPAFQHLKDGPGTMVSFVGVYYLAGLARWASTFGVLSTIGKLTLHVVLLLIFFERKNRSSALIFALLGASTAVDIAAMALAALGVLESATQTPMLSGFFIELVLSLVIIHKFLHLPVELQAPRYVR